MPVYNRVHLEGGLASGSERWATSCAFQIIGGSAVSGVASLTTWAENIATALEEATTIDVLKTGISSTGTIDRVRVYYYPNTGVPAGGVGESAVALTGLGSPSRPVTVSAVLSLRTGIPGRRTRGRMFWPALGNTINTVGRFTSTVTEDLATDGAQLLNIIGAASPPDGDARPMVVSAVGGLVTPVTGVSVGDVPDNMRSRKDALDETYFTAPV